jgi:23S rRNA pseudouridine1911/1915/1917 synthase
MQARLIEQFKAHKPDRVYIAIVSRLLRRNTGTFRSYLGTGKGLKEYSIGDPTRGKLAITHYSVQKKLKDTTVVEVRLETGRRNQIRVHFADHGHPVLGDPRYGRKKSAHSGWPETRIALHARSLGFEHPAAGAPLHFDTPLPDVMIRFIERFA